MINYPNDITRPLILSYYHPWIAGGGHRPGQLLNEDLKKNRKPVFMFYSSDNTEIIKDFISKPAYKNLTIIRLDERNIPIIYTKDGAATLPINVYDFINHYSPDYCRAHNPVQIFIPFIEYLKKKEVIFIYDEMDYWDSFSKKPWGEHSHRQYEKIADGVVSVSEFLTKRHSKKNRAMIPNAVSAEFFTNAKGLEKRYSDSYTVIYTGAMWPDWFNWDLVIHCVSNMPKSNFHLIGKWLPPPEENHGVESETKVEVIKKFPNVTLIDEVNHDELATHIKNSDVGIIPFRVNTLTEAASPLKAYDYLACGLPIVSTLLPEVQCMPCSFLAASADEFIKNLYVAADISRRGAAYHAIESYISNNLWHHRLESFDAFVIKQINDNK